MGLEELTVSTYNDSDIKPSSQEHLSNTVFKIVLEDWMYNFGAEYKESDFALLLRSIEDLIAKKLPLKFFIPGFPCKSSNNEKKVLGDLPDYSEFLAIRSLIATLRKLESIYPHGAQMIILSDYHTFDQYIAVEEDAYKRYHNALKNMIFECGASDIIQLISLSNFREFADTPGPQISAKLRDEYGGNHVLETFDEAIKKDPLMLEKYKQLKKFMQFDQSHNLPGSPRANSTRFFIKKIARGMMAQGVALDNFLRQQSFIGDYIRLSIHHHHPSAGKFAINMFKKYECGEGVLRTPWHHVVVFDSLAGNFLIDHKTTAESNQVENSFLLTVTFKGQPWFLLRLYVGESYHQYKIADSNLEASLIRGGCGIMIRLNTDSKIETPSSLVRKESLTNLIKEFGAIVLRGFRKFASEAEIINFYKARATFGILEWDFGPIHKVTPKENMPGYVNSNEGIPIHFDMVAPPKYMKISQKEHAYEDFICREFMLYCREITCKDDGATTFVDARSAILAMPGEKVAEWKRTTMAYETKLNQKSDKEVYFGGKGNVYEYPLVIRCPWTGEDVLRWWQSWTKKDHPDSRQHNWSMIKSCPGRKRQTTEELEKEIEKLALDSRFFFEHLYEEGDQVFVNNYTTLHGRNGFSNGRELWRLQAIPPSQNIPKYFSKTIL